MKHSKLVALILSVCLVLGMIPMFAGAETLSNNDFVYFGNEGQKWLIADNAERLAEHVRKHYQLSDANKIRQQLIDHLRP